MLTLFAMTAWGTLKVGREPTDARPKPASIILVGPPGSMKTELLMRFYGHHNPTLPLRSDVTVRGLWSLLLRADKGRATHVLLPEFNKVFQRKLSTAMLCLGTFTEAMDEGVFDSEVGPMKWSFKGARLGILGAMTGRTMRRRREILYEMGFLDRAAMLPWDPPDEQRREVMDRIARGDKRDLEKVILPVPNNGRPVIAYMPVKLGLTLKDYTWKRWPDQALRLFQRFRYLVMAAALLDGRESCRPLDIERAVMQFQDYWQRLVLSEAGEDAAPVGVGGMD